MANTHSHMQTLSRRIHEVADRLFAPLSARLGVASLREFEAAQQAFEIQQAAATAALDAKVRTPAPRT
jgi:hypothetical protein